jgi:type II secretory ATPase GspE/PulE/Tfp pilus assembly ATPase PilB-like protein
LRGPTLKSLEMAITRPHGIILVTGPTGSGKTTTLYSVLSRLNTTKVNIMTLEDPIEYEIVGLNQVQINPLAGLTFASGLRSFLRQDPNIILVGEIRDQETTSLAIQAALTGHLVFSTLHTNNAATAIPRLLDLGAEPFLIVSVLNAVQAQRIGRKICPACKETYIPSTEIVQDIKKILGQLFPTDKETVLYRGKGCKECTNTGYLGRIGIFEAISISSAICKMILEKASAEEIEKQAKSEGMITMVQDGYLKVLEGITTIEEILRIAKE